MIKRANEIQSETRENMRGGEGKIEFSHLLDKTELPSKCRLFSTISLECDASIGEHKHENETEIYHIIQGFAEYNDNGTIIILEEGDITVTGPGEFHSIRNVGEDELVFLAAIITE